jgi:hypothetical protein
MAKLVKKVFTSSGSWTAPAGITEVILVGFGGGGGGGTNQQGGGGSIQCQSYVSVVPGTTYTITIGAGGGVGGDGGSTTFGSLSTFIGASGSGLGGIHGSFSLNCAGLKGQSSVASGGSGSYSSGVLENGTINWLGYSGGVGGVYPTGGGGGGGGPNGAGGNGGAASTNGSSAAANSGAGGGGGGGSGAVGGSGGSGMLTIIYVDG